MRLILVALLMLLSLFPLAAEAKVKTCKTMIDGQEQTLSYERGDDAMQENRSTREWLFGRYGKVSCPGYITLRALTPGISDEQRTPFCLYYDEERETYTGFGLGERDAWLSCKAKQEKGRFCRTVNATTETVDAITGKITGASGKDDGEGKSFRHSASGALITSGAKNYVKRTLGSAANSALSTVTAPAAITAAVVSVVVVGGAVYVCGD